MTEDYFKSLSLVFYCIKWMLQMTCLHRLLLTFLDFLLSTTRLKSGFSGRTEGENTKVNMHNFCSKGWKVCMHVFIAQKQLIPI